MVVFLQLEDNKKTTDFLKEKIAHDPDYINSPINKVVFLNLFKYLFFKMKDTILHYAAYKENRDLVEFLLQHNAKIDIKNSVRK